MSGIIVGIDGSVHSRRALEWAIGEAAVRLSPLTVLTVQQDFTGFWGPTACPYPRDPSLVGQAAKEAQAETDSAVGSLNARSRLPSVTIRAVTGVPAEELLGAAQDADMIVVGSRGAGGFRKLLMGSVSSQVTHHARCPVVVIPADAQRDLDEANAHHYRIDSGPGHAAARRGARGILAERVAGSGVGAGT